MKRYHESLLVLVVIVCLVSAIPGGYDPFAGLPPDAECVPGSQFKIECNWCGCSEGGIAFCTLIGCAGLPPRPGPTCRGNAVWKDGGKICRCRNGHSVCTRN